MRASTRRGRGTVGLAADELEDRVRQLVPGTRIDFKRLRGYRSDRKPAPITRPLIVALAEVCGADPTDALRIFEQALTAGLASVRPPGPIEQMCGRAGELATCRQVLDDALGGRRMRSVLVVGGPGFGKTLMARVLEAGLASPPRAEVVRVSAAMGLDDLEARLAGRGPARPARSQPSAGDFADELVRRADVVRDALLARAHRCAMVLLVDDLHHASGPLIDLLARLADQEVPAALAIVATARPNPRIDALAHARTATVVTLGPLDLTGVAEMVEHRGPALAGTERAELARIVLESTQGHPAGAAMVVADHLDGRGWKPGSDLAGAAATAAQTTVERWSRRIAGLPARTRTVLAAASVVGTTFDIRLLRPLPALADIGDRVAESLEPAVDAGTVRWVAGANDAGSTYTFSHELARDATVAMVRRPVQVELSHQIAAVLASPVGPVTHPDPVARGAALLRHRRAAIDGYPEEALPLVEVALAQGKALVAALDDPGARDALEAGLDALRRLPDRSHPGLHGALLRWLAVCPSVGTDGRRQALTEALDVLLAAPDADPSMLVEITLLPPPRVRGALRPRNPGEVPPGTGHRRRPSQPGPGGPHGGHHRLPRGVVHPGGPRRRHRPGPAAVRIGVGPRRGVGRPDRPGGRSRRRRATPLPLPGRGSDDRARASHA